MLLNPSPRTEALHWKALHQDTMQDADIRIGGFSGLLQEDITEEPAGENGIVDFKNLLARTTAPWEEHTCRCQTPNLYID